MSDQYDEAAQEWFIGQRYSASLRAKLAALLRQTAADARAEQRERDARVCDAVAGRDFMDEATAEVCAADIRAQADDQSPSR